MDDHTLRITTSGSETCEALAGTFTSEPKGPPSTGVPQVAGAPACEAYTDCVCGLSEA